MSYSLVISETTAKSRTIGAALRSQSEEKSWRTIPVEGFHMDWPKRGSGIDAKTLKPKFMVKGKTSLNRLMAAADEATEVYLAMDAGPVGAAMAHHVRAQIVDRWPNKVVKRLRFREITEAVIARAIERASDVSELEAETLLSAQVLDRLIAQSLSENMSCTLGRAMAPAFSILATSYNSDEGCVAAHFTAERRLVRFLSEAIPVERCDGLAAALTAEPTLKTHVEDDLVAHPPRAYSTDTLLADISVRYGVKSIETMAQAWSLYEAGWITNPVGAGFGLNGSTVTAVHAKIAALVGKSFCGRYRFPEGCNPVEAIRPTSVNRDPSEIPKPVRQLYRMIWARTLAACSIIARVRQEVVSFKVDGVRFEAEGLEVIDPGYDRVGLGQFLRNQIIPADIKFEGAHAVKGSWPTEAEFIEALSPMKLDSPAYVIKALENNDYIEFEGTRIIPTKLGLEMLIEVKQVMPEFASPMFFTQVEYRLRQVAKGSFKRRPVLAEYEGWLKEKVRLLELPSL